MRQSEELLPPPWKPHECSCGDECTAEFLKKCLECPACLLWSSGRDPGRDLSWR